MRKISRRKFIQTSALTGIVGGIATTGIYKVTEFSSNAKGKIVIIGGGAAGLSIAALLQRWLKKPDITIIDPSDKQFYQPGFTLVASGVYKPKDVWKQQEKCIPNKAMWLKDSVIALNPDRRKITTKNNGELTYDYLVLTPGIQINWDLVEGITYNTLGEGNAHSIYDFEGAQKTWSAIQDFSKTGGKAIFTDTYTKHKCGGAPKKICLLTDDYMRKQKTRNNAVLDFYTADSALYDVSHYTPRLEKIYKERNVDITLNTRVKGVDTKHKKVYLEQNWSNKERDITEVIKDYDFLHFTPPMSVPHFIKESGLSWQDGSLAADGWVEVNKETLIHARYSNIICLGDCAGIPTSKTSAAIRKQVPIAAKNLILTMESKEPTERYNGYAACPIITDYGHVLLCEFDYDKNPQPSFPFSIMDMSKEQYAAWQLKTKILKPLYFHGMLNGYGF